jgi:hypothetical protein
LKAALRIGLTFVRVACERQTRRHSTEVRHGAAQEKS